ncbi:MAG: precorrin-2 C(20)-methyltransferase [Deltaproteobacteria bacterium]|nr:precorrin-2 C(20)-methyltransferase [Deltaproteobacteria bacterium]
MALGKFYGIGVGPGDPGLLTLKAAAVLRRVAVIFAATGANSRECVSGSVVEALDGCRARRETLVFAMAPAMADRRRAWQENAARVAAALEAGDDCAFVTIGDPLLYSTYTYLLREVRRRLPAVAVETIPGITSFQALAAANNLPLAEDRETMTVIPAWTESCLADPLLAAADTLVLLKTYRRRDAILAALREHGFADQGCLYASRLGLPDERQARGYEAIAAEPESYLSLIIARRRPAAGEPGVAAEETVDDQL